METESNSLKQSFSYYGKKIYYINPLIACKGSYTENEPEYWYEDMEDCKD